MSAGHRTALVQLLVDAGVLRFGEFTLKSGRTSPYFFDLGALHQGGATEQLANAYAAGVLAAGLEFDVVFGPAYKGIPIAVATAEALARRGRDVAWAFNRKEIKDHGEGGTFVGGDVSGRVLLVDDVLTAGTAVREGVRLIRRAGGHLTGVAITLDRREKTEHGTTAVEALGAELGVPVISLLTLEDVIDYLDERAAADKDQVALGQRIRAYRDTYCVPPPAR
ncbi:MAG: orotate phosphoribosyltransferase [Pseudomonadota bacterium]